MGANGKHGMNWCRQDLRLAVYMRDNHTCVYCHRHPDRLTLDHAIPRSEGGTNEPTNLLTSCLDCNTQKRDRTVRDFVTELWELRAREIYLGILRQLKRPLDRKKAREMLQRRRLTVPA